MFFDPVYFLFVLPPMLLGIWASSRVKSTFQQYAQVPVSSRMTGAEAAAAVCRAGGANVTVERVGGFLSDHYDPRTKTLRLSPEVYDGRSISSIAVGAHEAGHAIQDVERYPWLGFRSAMVPVTSFGSRFWIIPLIAGGIFQMQPLIVAGIVLFAATVVFQLVTLPVEFDASNRAKAVLTQAGIARTDAERHGVSKVLGAAALTYVAGALSSVATLAYLVFRYMGGSNND
ncbi:Putative neutral zinc metallopeptidase [Planctomycetes bacterium Poly30]|uniref:Neutral zinc metallopeptidase n=1 Tax=Saltatorellus ferox TaxID=2528018 RepID=A0A518EQQ4_9BACT|nr:Putative neutral zinc metallopeptidase [Planctomycetes bacterium Poly30]